MNRHSTTDVKLLLAILRRWQEATVVEQYIQDIFGFQYSFIGPALVILLAFTVFFAVFAIGDSLHSLPYPDFLWMVLYCYYNTISSCLRQRVGHICFDAHTAAHLF